MELSDFFLVNLFSSLDLVFRIDSIVYGRINPRVQDISRPHVCHVVDKSDSTIVILCSFAFE